MMNAFIQEHDLFPAALPFHTGRLSRDGHDLYFENAETDWAAHFVCMVAQVLALRRHTAAFSAQTVFAVFYLISVDLVNLVRLLGSI